MCTSHTFLSWNVGAVKKICLDDKRSTFRRVYDTSLTITNIQSRFAKCGVFPFDSTLLCTRLLLNS